MIRRSLSGLIMLCITNSVFLDAGGQSVVKLMTRQPEKLSVSLTSRMVITNGSTIKLGDSISVSGGTPPYSYVWTAGSNIVSISRAFQAAPSTETAYLVTVTDSLKCKSSAAVSVMVGIEENMSLPVSVYPVPATSYLVIDPGESLMNLRATLYDLSGNKVWEDAISGRRLLNVIFPPGIYVLEIRYKSEVSRRKIVISAR